MPSPWSAPALVAAISAAKAAGTTVILIAHRPNIMEKVDKVLFLNRGQQELFGPRDAVFAELANRARKVSQLPQMPRISPLVVKEAREVELQEAREA